VLENECIYHQKKIYFFVFLWRVKIFDFPTKNATIVV